MLKYFSSVVEKNINTGGAKLIHDMQKTIQKFLINENVQYKEYNFKQLRNIIHLIIPSPNANYLLFGYIGNPFFNTPFIVLYYIMFCFIAIKKRIVKEKFYIIIIDLIEWQSTLYINKKGIKNNYFRIFQCLLERILLSYVADEIISLIDPNFINQHYKIKKIWDLEFLDYYVGSFSKSDSFINSNILYAGDLSRSFDIDLLEEILKNLNDSYTLLLAGYGLKKEQKKQFKKYKNFKYFGQLNVEDLNNIAKKCQFGLIVYPPQYLYYNIISTTKIAFYLVNGMTVISTDLMRIKKLNEKYDFGYVLQRDELIKFIQNLSSNKIKRNMILKEQIAKGKFLYNILKKLDFS